MYPPNTDRLVCILRVPNTGIGFYRDFGYYRNHAWHSGTNQDAPLHSIIGWQEYPELPEFELR